jgi:hypothetical protein
MNVQRATGRTDCDRCGSVAYLNEQRLCARCVQALQALASGMLIERALYAPATPPKEEKPNDEP